MPNFEFSDEEKQLSETAREFTRKEIIPVAGELDEHGTFPEEICKKGWETGLMNCEIPEAYGGLGLSCLAHCLVLEEISYGCTGVNTTMAGNMLGTMPLIIAGTDAQKKKTFGRLLGRADLRRLLLLRAGRRLRRGGDEDEVQARSATTTSSPGRSAGSPTAAWPASTRCSRARRGPRATRGSPASWSTATRPACRSGKKENKMGQRCSNTTDVIFEDVKVGKDAVVGGEGEGFKVAMRTFDRTRPWIAAGAAGIIRRALDESRKYALERKTFGVPIAQHQAIQFMLAEMAIAYEATRLLCHKAAAGIDAGKVDSIVSSYAKAYGADAAMRVATDAVQIFGGYGYTKEYPVEKLMRDAKLLQIYEGTSQIQRMVIARNILGA